MSISFKRVLVDKDNRCEACSVFDINGDGRNEIICGEYWYDYPDGNRHKFCDVESDENYVWDFSDYPMDVDGDGEMEIITGSWWSEGLFYRKRAKDREMWETIKICELTSIETIRYFDIDGCGTPEIFPNMPGDVVCYFKLNKDEDGKGNGTFTRYDISSDNANHGLGFGDVTGNGKTDILLSDGWLEQPEDVYSAGWTRHYSWNIPMASVPVLAHDITGNGRNDIIIGAAHNYGLWWLEQLCEGDDAEPRFELHEIDMSCSQYHDMQLVDVDGDGEKELITGARFFAHNGNDPGERNPDTGEPNPIGTYVFKLKKDPEAEGGVRFEKNVLDLGSPDSTSGTGIYFWVQDMNGNGKPDIICPGKEGLYVFINECE